MCSLFNHIETICSSSCLHLGSLHPRIFFMIFVKLMKNWRIPTSVSSLLLWKLNQLRFLIHKIEVEMTKLHLYRTLDQLLEYRIHIFSTFLEFHFHVRIVWNLSIWNDRLGMLGQIHVSMVETGQDNWGCVIY